VAGRLAVGILGLIASGAFVAWRSFVLSAMERTEGVVVEHKRTSRRGTTYVVEFVPASRAAPVRVESSSTQLLVYGVGSGVGVYYDRAEPNDALIDSPVELWFGPSVAAGGMLGCWLPVGALWLLTAAYFRRRRGGASGSNV
jgi:hypothetical protein